ncbi:MAG: hypothetical protein ACTSP2_10030, partial [Alphaproteobacteria bacterium]
MASNKRSIFGHMSWLAALALAVWTGAGTVAAALDPLLVNRVEAALLANPTEEAFAPLEAVIVGNEATPSEKRDLLAELARLRAAQGHHGEVAKALTFQADLIVRIDGSQSPELAPVLAA